MLTLWKMISVFLVSCLAGLAIPVAGISGLAMAVFSLLLVLGMFGIGSVQSSELIRYLLISLAIFALSFAFLFRLQRRAKRLVANINRLEQLSFNDRHLLGCPAPAFLAFDQQHRKIAVCSAIDNVWRIHDFCYLLSWQVTWRETEKMEITGSRQINATGISTPIFQPRTQNQDFALELQTADPDQPLLSFPMSRRAAETWCARLNAIFHG